MANVQDLKRRIRSVRNTRKITRAMELVAAAKLRRAEARITALRPYAGTMNELIAGVGRAASSVRLPLLEQRENVESVAIVPLTGDRGLAGSFNAQVIRRSFALERALRAELRAKLVDDAIIEGVLEERRQLDRVGLPPGGAGTRAAGTRAAATNAADTSAADADCAAARGPDALAAARLLIRSERQLLRVEDLRRRRQRTWAILARAGFDSDTAREAMLEAERRWAVEEAADEPPD